MSKLLEIALSQYGQKEIEGNEDNKTILKYSTEAGHVWVSHDETPWCSIFVDWVAMKAGVERTHKANALSWLSVGELTMEPITGDIAIFKRGTDPKSGHVGIFIAYEVNAFQKSTGYIYILGGNQNNQVKISTFHENDLLGFVKLRETKNKIS